MSMKALKSKDFTVPDDYEPIDYLRILWSEGLDKLIVPEGYDSAEYLKKLSYEGLYRRYPSITDELRSRLDYELDAIKQTDLTSIFLLSYDLFDYLRTNDIEVSPGCGAQPGCLVSYCLGITDIDSFEYDLLFERLINKLRTRSFYGPFIQLEIGGSKRLNDYVVVKYGEGMPAFLKSLDMRFFDLKELSVIKDTLRRISRTTGNPIDLTRIDYNDAAVYEYIKSSNSDDLYILNEFYNKKFAERQKLQSFEDLVARMSIDRPGPDEFSGPTYVNNQYNPERIHYECPKLKPILESTYGCIIYQEQIMRILHHLGGMSLEQSDLARRDMAKKKLASIESYRGYFVSGNDKEAIPGCVANGIDAAVAQKLFDRIAKAAAYAFNQSHAVACAIVTYRMAWLKYYFNFEYTEALNEFKDYSEATM